jgi:hypothetical protein
VRTLGSCGSTLHLGLKGIPRKRDRTRTVKCSRVATCMGDALGEDWLTPTSPPLIPRYPTGRYGAALAELNPALTPLSARWCVRKAP